MPCPMVPKPSSATFMFVSIPPSLLHRLHPHRDGHGFVFRDYIPKRAAKVFKLDLRHVSCLEPHPVSIRQTIRTHEVDVHRSRLAVPRKLEMMMLQVRQAVTHVFFSGANSLLP